MTKSYNISTVKTLFCILTLCISIKIKGQSTQSFLPNIIPPSPTAYELGNYGNVPVGMFTGSPNINIPIYTYKTANLTVPITMFYTSNGVKVDEVSSNVGQSWNMNFGGVITRVVRDKPDEEAQNNPIPMEMTETINSRSPQALDYFKFIGESDVDSESDLYSFNFSNYSGKFIFDNTNNVMLMPMQPIIIEKTAIIGDFFDFRVTGPDGIVYLFEERETSTFTVGGVHNVPTPIVTSWYLTKIIHPKGDEISFAYDNLKTLYNTTNWQNLKILSPSTQSTCTEMASPGPFLSTIKTNQLRIEGKLIKTISSNKAIYGTINFGYTAASSLDVTSGNKKISNISIQDKTGFEIEKINFTYTTTVNKRVFLDKIQYKDISKNYQLDYYNKENLPERLSYSQDHWGYYNGQHNTNIVPKNIMDFGLSKINYYGADKEPNATLVMTGMLKKITYPTKGYTELVYESNDYYGTQVINPPKINGSLHIVKLEDDYGSTSDEYILTNSSTQDIYIEGGVSFYCQDPNLNVGKNTATYSVRNITTDKLVTSFTMTPNMTDVQKRKSFNAIAGQNYLITLRATSHCTAASIYFKYDPSEPITINTNIITGGLRVKQTTDNSINSLEPIIKRFFYAKKSLLNESSGEKGKKPYYMDFIVNRINCGSNGNGNLNCDYRDIKYLNLSSSSMVSLFDTGNSNVFYKYVTVSYGNSSFANGGEEHEYIVNRDGPGNVVWGPQDIKSAPFTNFGWDNGLEKKTIYFNKSLIPVKETTNEYEEKTAFKKEVTSYHSRKQFELVCSGTLNYTCTQADAAMRYARSECITAHKHYSVGSIGAFFGLRDNDCIAPGANNITTYFNHICYGKPGTIISNLDNLENISVVAYKDVSYWHYLKKTTVKQYDINGSNPIIMINDYQYNSPGHLQLSSQSTTSSNKQHVETKYYYPPDLLATGVQTTIMRELTDKNRIDVPVKTETFVDIQTSENNIKYEQSIATGNLVLPIEIHEMKGFGDIDLTSNVSRKMNFILYDSDLNNGVSQGNGNVLEYKVENGISVSIIWGYNKTQPIAKIENASYSEVLPYVANLQSISDTGTEDNLRTALTTLRNSLPNAIITSYTYRPIIGISSVTDPKGQCTYYEYDEFNRLQFIKDAQRKILFENQYHYKN